MSNIIKEISKSINDIKNGERAKDPIKKYKMCIFIDLDNTSWNELGKQLNFDDDVLINIYADEQHSPMLHSEKMMNRIKNTKAEINKYATNMGKNSTDFIIVCDVATILAKNIAKYVYIISKDTDYDEVLDRLRNMYGDNIRALERFSSIGEIKEDFDLMECKTKADVDTQIAKRFKPYRRSLVFNLLNAK